MTTHSDSDFTASPTPAPVNAPTPAPGLRVLGISGSTGEHSRARGLLDVAISSARERGADTRIIDLATFDLPLYRLNAPHENYPEVAEFRAAAAWAEAFIIAVPEYHGAVTGALKNAFDYLYSELAGKLFGIVATTGGSQGVSCLDNLRTMILYCHGWALPYNVSAMEADFGEDGLVLNPRVLDRATRVGYDVATFGGPMLDLFNNERAKPATPGQQGFAQWHA